MNVEMYDDLDEVIMNHYSSCERFIDEGLSQKDGVILIHWYAMYIIVGVLIVIVGVSH